MTLKGIYWNLKHRLRTPSYAYKCQIVAEYGRRYGLRTLVETGTFKGDMVWAQKDNFYYIYSIELSPDLHRAAIARFNKYFHVRLICGDSGKWLHNVMESDWTPILVYLDAHYQGPGSACGDRITPILQELEQILPYPQRAPVILIDDAHAFVNYSYYPTLEELIEFIHKRRDNVQVAVIDDVIRVTPIGG